MIIKVYGPGCNSCQKAAVAMEEALQQAGVESQVEKIVDVQELIKAEIFVAPVVEVNGIVMSRGRVPKVSEAVVWIMNALIEEG